MFKYAPISPAVVAVETKEFSSLDRPIKPWNPFDSLSKEERSTIRFVKFDEFRRMSSFPRYPENKNVTFLLREMTPQQYQESLIVFISHRWLRGSSDAKDFEKEPHPDNKEADKFHLCVSGIEKLLQLVPKINSCYLWFDFSCLDQDEDPSKELKFSIKLCFFAIVFLFQCMKQIP